MMKDKEVFKIDELNMEAFARSLGLSVTPRVRFLDRKKKREALANKEQPPERKEEDPKKRTQTTFKFGEGKFTEYRQNPVNFSKELETLLCTVGLVNYEISQFQVSFRKKFHCLKICAMNPYNYIDVTITDSLQIVRKLIAGFK